MKVVLSRIKHTKIAWMGSYIAVGHP